jgi:hypothetical protein
MAHLSLDWLHLLTLLGAAQGLLLTVVLATQRRNRIANRILAVAMFTFSIHLASNVYLGAHLERVFPHFFGIAYPPSVPATGYGASGGPTPCTSCRSSRW